MKIGVYLNLSEETSGGSYQFNKSIYESIVSEQINCDHQFFFIFEENNSLSVKPDIALPSKNWHRLYYLFQLCIEIFLLRFKKRKNFLQNCRASWMNKKLHASGVQALWAVNPLSYPVNVPYITTSWDIAHLVTPYFKEISEPPKLIIKRDNECKSVFQNAFIIIVGTDYGKKQLSNLYLISEERILVQPLPIPNLSISSASTRNKYQFIYPANFWSHKNHLVIIKALHKLLSNENYPVKFIFTGSDKGNLKYLKALTISLRLEEHIEFRGFVSRRELIQLYQSSNACVYASLIGPDNLPPLEAIAFGSKSIVAEIPGAREQLGQFSSYFDPYCPDSLSKQIKLAIEEYNSVELVNDEVKKFIESRTTKRYVQSVIKELDKLQAIMDLGPKH